MVVIDHYLGHGQSAIGHEGYRVVDHARATAGFLRKELADQTLTMMGHSLGAMVALSRPSVP
ncbi:alpha/beta fold hydrolase [Roseiconus lacunae]|uniref:alpha/beta fold hydrolase n=1 Tax=Roseiconus lacunae TaxID=2605694 RepID=UPI0011F26573|nr:lysophospholipase [Roseiconus lacunae]